jgi:pimeloyl-ACP methyl ester carboxylesterase
MENRTEYLNFALPIENDLPGLTVRGKILLPEGPDPDLNGVVIIIPGFLGHTDWGFYPSLAKILAGRGYAVILFNHSTGGAGENGKPYSDLANLKNMTIERDLSDVVRIFKALKKNEMPGLPDLSGLPVFPVGHSKGGAIGILSSAGEPSVAALVSVNGTSDLLRIPKEKAYEIIERGFQEKTIPGTKINIRVTSEYWKQLIENPGRYDVFHVLKSLTKKILFVQGVLDDKIPVSEAKAMHEAAPAGSELLLFEGVDHNLGYISPSEPVDEKGLEVLAAIADWIDRALPERTEQHP